MSESRLALIRFVTARQARLRGLHELAFAVHAGSIVLLAPYWGVLLGPRGFLAGMAVIVAFQILGVLHWCADRAIARRYDATVGRVGDSVRHRFPGDGQSLLALGAALDLTGWFPAAGHSGFALLLGVYGVWIAVRDFPWRGYYAALLAIAAWAPLVRDPSSINSHLPAYVTGLAALGTAGLLDHLVLVFTIARLKGRAAASSPD